MFILLMSFNGENEFLNLIELFRHFKYLIC